jgi:hypothetical protein
LFLAGSVTSTDASFGTLLMEFADNAFPAAFPEGLPGPGEDLGSPLLFHDYESMSELGTYSDLEYLEYRTTLGVRYQTGQHVQAFASVSYYDLEDDAPYLQDATGSVGIFAAGLVWSY